MKDSNPLSQYLIKSSRKMDQADWDKVEKQFEKLRNEERRDPMREAWLRHERQVEAMVLEMMQRGFPPHHLRRHNDWEGAQMVTHIYTKSGATHCLPTQVEYNSEVWFIPPHADDRSHRDAEKGVVRSVVKTSDGVKGYKIWFYNDGSPNAKFCNRRLVWRA